MDANVIVTGLFTLAAGLGGVWITQRNAVREAHQTRVEARRADQRRVFSEMFVAGRDKVTRYHVLLPAFHKFSDEDRISFASTEGSESVSRINAEFDRALVQATLLVGDQPLSAALDHVRRLNDQFTDRAMGPAIDKKLGFDGLLQGLRYVRELAEALNGLELLVVQQLRVSLAPAEPATRRRVHTALSRTARLARRPYYWWADKTPPT